MVSVLTDGIDTPYGANPLPIDAVLLDDGTYVGFITQPTPDPQLDDILIQRYAADGTLLGGPVATALHDTHSLDTYDHPRLIPIDGGYMVLNVFGVSYFDSTYEGMKHQLYTYEGVKTGQEVGSNAVGVPVKSLDAEQLDTGHILISYLWGSIIFSEVYDTSGNLLAFQEDRGINAVATAALDGGGYVQAFTGLNGRLYAHVYGADLQPVGAAIGITPSWANVSAITPHGNGGFAIAWLAQAPGPVIHSYLTVQNFDAGGHATSAATIVGDFPVYASSTYAFPLRMVELSDGGFVLVWQQPSFNGGDPGIFARRFDDHGDAVGFATSVAGLSELKGLVATADGGFVVEWRGTGDSGYDVYHTAFSATTDMSGANLLFGTSGNDSLDGRQGADVMAGGVGNDTYYIDNAGDQVQELAGAGTDWVFSFVTYTLPTDVEILTLRGTADIDGLGNALNNRISGNAGANHLYGGAGNDDLRALAGNDTLSGNSGADTMYGGAGNDLYYADDAGDRVFETATADGVDTVRASVDFALGANFENLTLVGTANLRGFGNTLNNTITGNSGGNILRGLDGNDVINGGAGADSLIGGTGDDTYYVDNAGDKVYETAGEGTDRVYSSVTFAVNSQSIESVTLTGSANINAAGGDAADQVTGNAGANILTGGAGSDTLIGGAGSDTFVFGLASGTDTISDFLSSDNDRIELHAYSLGVVNGGGITITQSGLDTIIDLGGGNFITVVHAVAADVNSHIIW